ncbi:multicopper oxidase family protein [Hamadaea tsunoensis]|uniref:multicopper oxidase family protein n=1 Tax=Hamadaea tsunoensis TaxID=53368 RepID=UPI000424F119|nr:multicopper oxidase domain-containing protein [Hamadaea tsunoensis]
MNRRNLLRAGVGLAGAAVLGTGLYELLKPGSQTGQLLGSEAPIPPAFQVPLPIPAVLTPSRTDGTTDYYEITQGISTLSVLPGLKTPAWTYNGTFPGPTIVSRSGRKTVVKHTNQLPEASVVHLHGGHTPADSDGYPIDLVMPVSGHDMASMSGMNTMQRDVSQGSREYAYPFDQPAATLWYHDHRMGATAPNVWKGLAGFHLVRDDESDALPLPRGDRDIPLMLADRSFAADGSFLYKALMPGVLGDVQLVNGAPWPVLAVDPARYRLRLLNAANARRYRLELDPQPPGGDAFVQIAADGGLLARPVGHDAVQLAPGERFEVVVDFAKYKPGTRVRLVNTFASGRMREVMRFDVTGSDRGDDSSVPATLAEIPVLDPAKAVATRTFRFHQTPGGTWTVNDLEYKPGRALATPKLGSIEVWRFVTDYHHPIHLHLNHFQVLSRNLFEPGAYDAGWKDTIDLRPAEGAEIVTRFTDYAGAFLLHCHNLEHEDMAMMADFQTS